MFLLKHLISNRISHYILLAIFITFARGKSVVKARTTNMRIYYYNQSHE